MLTATDRSTAPVRRVRILTAGGTIAMMGEGGATPELDAEALVASVPGLQVFPDLEAITVLNKPSAHLTLEDQLRICRAARDAAHVAQRPDGRADPDQDGVQVADDPRRRGAQGRVTAGEYVP